MANRLFDPGNWTLWGQPATDYWDGSAYHDEWADPTEGGLGPFRGFLMAATSVQTGDQLAADYQGLGSFIVLVDNLGSISDFVAVTAGSASFDFVIPYNADWRLVATYDSASSNPALQYNSGYTLTPTVALTANDDAATTPSNTPVNIPVLANDTLGENPVQLADLVGPPTIASEPANGSVEVQPDGSIVYTPNPGFTGEDTFGYQIETCTQVLISIEAGEGEEAEYFLALASGEVEPDWWGSSFPSMMLPSGGYELEYSEFTNRYLVIANSIYPVCGGSEQGTVTTEEDFAVCVTWMCPPALLNLGCSWEPRNAPSTGDNGGVALKPDWFIDNDPFTVSDPVNGWTETWQWDGDLGYDLLASTGTSTRPNCCGSGGGLTLTQGSNIVDLDWQYNCA